MSSLFEFDHCKVRVPTPEISSKVQKKLFELGYAWRGDMIKEVQFTKEPYLYIDKGSITYSNEDDADYFLVSPEKEVTYQEILDYGKEIEKLPKINMETKYRSVVTKEPVRILCVDLPKDEDTPVLAVNESTGAIHFLTDDGRAGIGFSDPIIEPVPERIHREGWVNVYPESMSKIFELKEDADELAAPSRIACIKVTVEGETGDGLYFTSEL